MFAACSSPPRMDLRHNESLYRPTGYVSKLSADRAAFIAPIADERQLPEDKQAYPVAYLGDGDWERPVPVMVDEILREELRTAQVFAEILPAPRPDALLVRPILRAFEGGLQEQLYGRRSMAHLALVIEIYGPEETGERKLFLSQPFFERPISTTGFKPPSPRLLMGSALHATMSKLVSTIDASNVARSAIFREADLRKK